MLTRKLANLVCRQKTAIAYLFAAHSSVLLNQNILYAQRIYLLYYYSTQRAHLRKR